MTDCNCCTDPDCCACYCDDLETDGGYMQKYNEIKFKNTWIHYGGSFKRIGLGFNIDSYSINIDFLWFWVSIER
jgi:hypothetical protein